MANEEYFLADYYTAVPSLTEFDEQNASMHSSLCEFICFWFTTSFEPEENLMNLSDYDTCALAGECPGSSPQLYAFKELYFSIFYEWNPATETSTINNPFNYTIEPVNDYQKLTITNAEGDWAVYTSAALSTQNLETTNFSLYPNPTKNIINVQSQQLSLDNATIEVYDFSGKTVKSKNFNGQKRTVSLNVSRLKTGIYFLKIKTANGASQLLKFIKQ